PGAGDGWIIARQTGVAQRIEALAGGEGVTGLAVQPAPAAVGVLLGEQLLPQVEDVGRLAEPVFDDQTEQQRFVALARLGVLFHPGERLLATAGDRLVRLVERRQCQQRPHRAGRRSLRSGPALAGELAARFPGTVRLLRLDDELREG